MLGNDIRWKQGHCGTPSLFKRHQMRQPDINRVNKAREHLKAAITILSNINWLNTSMIESNFITLAKEDIEEADAHLTDIINIQADR